MAVNAATLESAPGVRPGTFLGHPKGLFVLFFTEMWERFSYYGMRALLVLYMVNHLFLRPDVGQAVLGYAAIKGVLERVFGPLAVQPLSSQIYGLYTGFVFFSAFFGGILADRLLGQRRTVVVGAILMAIGHFLMASEHMFFLALLFLIAGNGAFKPNISTQVGLLYPQGDPRRDGAFTIFYMGINIGAFFSPLVCGTLGQTIGWHYGFGAAGVGMVVGLCIYLWGQKYLAPDVLTQRKAAAKIQPAKERMTGNEWLRVGVLCVTCLLVSMFWAVFEQQGNTMQLWADRNTNWAHIPSTWFQAFNPFWIIALAPLLNIVWAKQAARGNEPASLTKMGFGFLFLGIAFLIMVAAAQGMSPDTRRSVLWLVGTTFVVTLGELYLSPIGLSFVTKVAPARMVSMLMGVWFLSNFIGNYLTGYLGTYWEKIPHTQFFTLMSGIGIAAGITMLVLSRPMNKVVAAHEKKAA